MSLVKSKVAHANILSIDTSDAMKMDGVFGFVSAKDVPRKQPIGLYEDERVFVETKVGILKPFYIVVCL